MSEKLYTWLLRLFPKSFRETYESDALDLFRDRSRDERGFWLRIRLWADLLTDLVISVPGEHFRARSLSKNVYSSQEATVSPNFALLAPNRIPPAFWLLGSVLALAAESGLLALGGDVHASLSRISIGCRSTGLASLPAESDPEGTDRQGPSGTWHWADTGQDRSGLEASSPSKGALRFASVRIKRSHSSDSRSERMRVLGNAGVLAQAVPLVSLLSFAYDVPANPSPRLAGLPDWSLERYDIEAKGDPNPSELSNDETLHRAQVMMRHLLTERFHLVIRGEEKMMPVYALSVLRGEPKLQPSPVAEQPCVFDTDPAGCRTFVIGFGHPLQARAVDMDDLAHYIENWTDWPVINQTGLGKLFTLHTRGWRPRRLPPPPPGTATNPNLFATLPTILTVLADIGLTLDEKQGNVRVYTIEHVEQPANN